MRKLLIWQNLLAWLALLLGIVAPLTGAESEAPAAGAGESRSGAFAIRVVDDQTGRGVPLVELKTVNSASWWTDSAGFAAFDEPGLMGQEVFFNVSSPGYEYPKDHFDNRGVKLRPVSGGRAEVRLKRLNIAERLYRITGQGIYRDSMLLGQRPPLNRPLLNAQVFGQDTVIVTPYHDKIYWFWGDTDRASYPLGNFGASGATSELPGRGGLDPGTGVDLSYFVGKSGFSKPMCPDAEFGAGIKWIEGVMTLRDERGQEQLLARVACGAGLQGTRDWRLGRFKDDTQTFEAVASWDIHDTHDSAHPFHANVAGRDYFYLYPNWRVPASLEALREMSRYEALTCVSGEGRMRGADTGVDRNTSGELRYSWKAGADRLDGGRLRDLIRFGKIQPAEAWLQLRDVETGAVIEAGRGSVFWNEYRQRWVMLCSGGVGEVWFATGDTPTGPWVYARRVITHGHYNFYNPTQHPLFDQDHGRLIYFEGTYTASFSDAPIKTPRYDYNQMMYRLALDDPRLNLPVPVYRVRLPEGGTRLLLREGVAADGAWERVLKVEFFALAAAEASKGQMAIYAEASALHLQTKAPSPSATPLFFGIPAARARAGAAAAQSGFQDSVAATEILQAENGEPLCRVWKNPMTVLALDFQAQPELQTRH